MTRRVLVTGGARGMGKAITERYAAAGWTVMAPARAELDLASTVSTTRWLAGPGKDLGVDALVNNAGENKINTPADETFTTSKHIASHHTTTLRGR